MKFAKLEIGELTFEDECRIPTLALNIVDTETNEIVNTGYLTPFRAYRFQVSGNTHGGGDYGSSSVNGRRYLEFSNAKEYGIMMDFALSAIFRFVNSVFATKRHEYCVPVNDSDVLWGIRDFIDKSMTWIIEQNAK